MQPFAYLHRDRADHVEVLTGDVVTAATLAGIPLTNTGPTLAVIPYRQITERGFECVDDSAPLECLRATGYERRPLSAFTGGDLRLRGGAFDLTDDEYAAVVERVLRDEIGRGEGANFVIHRSFTATVDGDPLAAAIAAFHRLLTGERGAYWTFLVHTGTRTLVGATPERHVSVADGLVMMNPISGTHRHDDTRGLLDFLADPKETEELYMVLDEELKMMAVVAERGGQVVGPYLKRMAHLTHTEYLLAGHGTRDVREVLRETMFAPTVTGSPIENACRVIARHEGRGRGYYAGVLALLDHDENGRQTLDAPILIRTAEISPDGTLRLPVGATLVRHSTPAGEVAETHAKAAGLLSAFGVLPKTKKGTAYEGVPGDPRVDAALAARNTGLSRFWLDQRERGALEEPALAGRTAVVVDAEDTFTAMLAHQLRALGLDVSVVPWQRPGDLSAADLVVVGPGPGDPSSADGKMLALRTLVDDLLATGRPTLAVCLGHQILAAHLGLPLVRRDEPYQGVARDIDLFGETRRVGFYASFTAVAPTGTLATAYGPVEVARAEPDGAVHAVRGRTFAGVQFHPESVLSRDGLPVLTGLVHRLLVDAVSPAHSG